MIIAKDIGWNISISNSVNQNEVINIAVRLCAEEGIKLKKNPSFNLGAMKITLYLENGSKEALGKIKNEFEESTGCN